MDFLDQVKSRAARRAKGEYRAFEHVRPGVCFAQHDHSIANASGAAVRSDINDALAAIVSRNSGATAPSTTFAYMVWVDTTTGTLKRRNAANSGWIIESTIDEARVMARSSNTILDVSDIGKMINFSGSFTQTFDAVATLGDGWYVDYKNGSGTITLDPNSTETVNGATTATIPPYHCGRIWCTGSALHATIMGSTENGQIKFPATMNASSDANTLDDYEEGDWTPVLTFSTPGNVSVTYSVQTGKYDKVGRRVTASFNIGTSAFTHTTASGTAQITGFPFTSASIDGVGPLLWRGITKANYTDIHTYIASGGTVALLNASGSGQANAVVTTADMPTGGTVTLYGDVSYLT
jgi:hypothetical protein